jgi:uncharacterized protein YndB with AHSA1/START domain
MKTNISAEVSIIVDAPVTKVWDALTIPEQIKQYFFGTDTVTDWKPGSPITFSGEWQGKKYHDKGTILEFREKSLIKYDYWSSMSGIEDKPENYAIITYKVSGNDNNVTVTITQENIPDEKTKEHSAENWKMLLGKLKEFVESN